MTRPYRPAYTPPARDRATTTTQECKKSCCWSPFGHSTVRDHLPQWHADACHCHTTTGGTR